MTKPELRLVAELSTAFHFRAAGPQAPACLSEGFFAVTGAPYPPSAGWHWTEAIHPDDRTSFLARWTQADRDRVHLDTEVRLTGGDGHAHWFRIRAAVRPAPDRHGDPSGWVGVGMDVRDQHVLTLERNEAQAFSVQAGKDSGMAGQLKAEFLATASHELRTPLNAIAGWLHVLELHAKGDLQQWHALAAIERNVLAEKALIDGLLDVSQLTRGVVTMTPSQVDLVALVRGCLSNARPGAVAKGVVLRLEAPVASVIVTADRRKIEQVTWHLVANAIRFSSHPGEVHVHVGHDRAHAWLRVQDFGEGIDAAFLPHVFLPFSQRPRIAPRAGLGLGLTVVRALVELHGGSVSAASDGCGCGAVFEVTLPHAA